VPVQFPQGVRAQKSIRAFEEDPRHAQRALADTLKDAEQRGAAILLEYSRIADRDVEAYAQAAVRVVRERMWERASLDLEKYSWSSIADEWIGFMQLA